ncbi:NfeD family protein [Pelistega ratti]|nr:NfeD family protein [Pelistega ratti]
MWVWFVLAGICLSLELMLGSFYLLFLTVGLLVGGIVAWIDMSIYWQLFAFALTAILCVYVFKLFGISKHGSTKTATSDVNVNLDIGATVEVTQWSHRQTTVHYRGAQWKAMLEDSITAEVIGQHTIVDIQGSMLILSPK